jgi:hypothetical protein
MVRCQIAHQRSPQDSDLCMQCNRYVRRGTDRSGLQLRPGSIGDENGKAGHLSAGTHGKCGEKFFAEICRRDLEGIVAKRKLPVYQDDGNGRIKI